MLYLDKKSICVGMPLFNESKSINKIINDFSNFLKVHNIEIDLLIIDDCSTDNSFEILKKLEKKFPFLHVYQNNMNLKHGLTIYNVYNKISEMGYKYIIGCDADGQFDLNDIIKLIKNYQPGSLVIGRRLKRVEGGIRSLISNCLKYFLKIYFGIKIPDSNSPLRLFSVEDFNNFKKIVQKSNLDYKVTNILLSVYFAKLKGSLINVQIQHLKRISGDSGTMWQNQYFKNFSFYLFKFAFESFFEILRFKKIIDNSSEKIQ